MKDKEARLRIDARTRLIQDNKNNIYELFKTIKELKEELADVRKMAQSEPNMYADADRPFYMSLLLTPKRISLARAIQLILKHLNLELSHLPEGYELKEIVDDDKAKD